MKLFLTHSYFYQLDPKQWKNKTPYPPLATITALAQLRHSKFEPVFYDTALDPSPEKCIAKMHNEAPKIVIIYEDGFNYLTKMCLTVMRNACFEMINAAKSIGATVIVSSSDSTDHYNNYHDQGADFIIHGEAEQTLLELISELSEGKNEFEVINGISFKLGETYTKTKARLNLRELEHIKTASWEAIDIDAYRSIWKNGKFPFTLNISTTRGCPFKCNWCAKPIYGNRYNSRSVISVVNEIEELIQNYDVQHFWVTDDIFGLKPGWVTEFNQLVKEKKLKFKYKIQSRADLLLKDETIEELASSGLEEAWIGAESGSQKILDSMDKGTTVEQINSSSKLLQQKGVRVAYFLQFGYLGETKEDVDATIQMVKNNQPDDIGISVSYPLPGTLFYDKVKEQMNGKHNWTDSDDLDLMFNGTFSSNYYKKLQRFVHHQFRFQQGIKKIKKPSAFISWRYAFLIPYNWFITQFLGFQIK